MTTRHVLVRLTGYPSWKRSLPHVIVATLASFLFGYHLGFVLNHHHSIYHFYYFVIHCFSNWFNQLVVYLWWCSVVNETLESISLDLAFSGSTLAEGTYKNLYFRLYLIAIPKKTFELKAKIKKQEQVLKITFFLVIKTWLGFWKHS